MIKMEIPKELEPLAQRARKYKSANEFVAEQIFSQSTSGEIQRVLEDNFEGETFADKLTNFYNQKRRQSK